MDKVSQWAFIAMGHPGYQKVDYRLMIHFSIFSLGRENNNFSSGHRCRWKPRWASSCLMPICSFPLEGII
jgi:hypothetical protein